MTNHTLKQLQFAVGQNGRPFDRAVDLGFLVIRIGLGGMMMYYGLPKILGGPEMWAEVGAAMGNLGVTFAPKFWGLSAGLSETLGGLLVALGLFFRPATLIMIFTMFMAALTMFKSGQGLFGASHAIDLGIVLLGLMIAGPGWFSLDKKLFGNSVVTR